MSVFTLRRGTRVKHGTTSGSLRSILTTGLRPGSERHELRLSAEPAPEISAGIYVGDLMGYFGATASFGAAARELVLQEFTSGTLPRDPSAIVFPVVLEIELQEDCEVWADEDFIPSPDGRPLEYTDELLRLNAEPVWNYFRTGAIVREGGIPSSWITRFEFPIFWVPVSDQAWQSSNGQSLGEDAQLMVWSHIQNFEKEPPEGCWAGFDQQMKRVRRPVRRGFSRRLPFDANGVNRFFEEAAFRSATDAFRHMFVLFNCLSQLLDAAGVGGVVR